MMDSKCSKALLLGKAVVNILFQTIADPKSDEENKIIVRQAKNLATALDVDLSDLRPIDDVGDQIHEARYRLIFDLGTIHSDHIAACFDFGFELTTWATVRGGYPLSEPTAMWKERADELEARLRNKATVIGLKPDALDEVIAAAKDPTKLPHLFIEIVGELFLSIANEEKALNNRVFIVHGHDEAKKWELKNFLIMLGLQPIILHEQDDLGKTIIEKFEYYASQCDFAFVLLTPDDQTPTLDATESKWRARQNVIMELGWFMAKLGRDRVVILHKGAVEIPSDVLGVIYLPFNNSILEVSEKIRQRLRGANILKQG
jgi:hypothetical protein